MNDFELLRPAERQFVAWLQAENREFCVISPRFAPVDAPVDVRLRASFVRYLSLGRIAGGRREAKETQYACFLEEPEGGSYPRFVPWVYSADTLIPVVSFEMQSYWIPDDTRPFGALARAYLWAHIAAGWALSLLAVAGFSGLIRTDNTK